MLSRTDIGSISPSVLRSSGISAMSKPRGLGLLRARRSGPGWPSIRMRAVDPAQHPEQRQQQLALTLAVETAEADDLAAADAERDVLQLVAPAQMLDLERLLGRRWRARAWPGTPGCTRGRSSARRSRRRTSCPWRRSRCGGRCGTPSRRRPAPRSRACGARCRGSRGRPRAAGGASRRPSRRRPRSAPRSPRRGSGAWARGRAPWRSRPSGGATATGCGRAPSDARPRSRSGRAAPRRAGAGARRSIRPKRRRRIGDADVVRDREVGQQRELLEDADDARLIGRDRGTEG